MNTLLRLMGCAALAVLATGCASINPPPPVDVLPTTPPPLAALPRPTGPATGSLFHAASYRPAFEDQRARMVGDLVTIAITEKIEASQRGSSILKRNPEVSGSIKALPFISGNIAKKTGFGASYTNDFEGGGDTISNNNFESYITATVTEVLPNGHLVITGEKQVGVSRSVDLLRFSGTVDPRHLGRKNGGPHGSEIDSRYVANVRVISRGLGEQAEAQAMGWLARAFNTFSPF